MESKIKRIAIADPSWLMVEGLQHLISIYKEFRIVWAGQELAGLNDKIIAGEIDVLLINPMMFDFSRRSSVRTYWGAYIDIVTIAIVYNHMDSEYLKQFDEVIEVTESKHRIIKKIQNVRSIDKESSCENAELSDREKEILIAVAKGLTNKEIADSHNISIHTVISHRKNITRKTGIKSVSGLTVYALLNNLLNQNDID